MNILQLINDGADRLRSRNINSSKLDSEILLSKILNKKRENLLTHLDKKIDQKNIDKFYKLILRRSFYEPVAYILNIKEFWSKTFEVDGNTLIPRPETELLVEKLVSIFKKKNN